MDNNRRQDLPQDFFRKPAVWKVARLYGLISHIGLALFAVPIIFLGFYFLKHLIANGFLDLFFLAGAIVTLGVGITIFVSAWTGILRVLHTKTPPADPIDQPMPAVAPDGRGPGRPQPGVPVGRQLAFFSVGLVVLGIALAILYFFILPDLPRFTRGDQLPGLLIPVSFALVGVLLLWTSVRQLARIVRFGRLPLTVIPAPPLLGETFRIEVPLTQPLSLHAAPQATLTCAKLRVHKKRRGHTIHRTPFWNTTSPLQAETRNNGTVLSASFTLPTDQPTSTMAPNRFTDRIAWLIEVKDSRGELPQDANYEILVTRVLGD
jgi:hypothetical protein